MSMLDVIIAGLSEVLPGFNNSDGSIENKIINVVGTVADTYDIERNSTIDVINTALANQRNTSKGYYRRKASEFQQGDTILYDPVNQGAYYDPVNPENQIIKQAYIVGSNPNWTLLVNALDASGHLRVLTADELAAFRTYFDEFQPLGLELNIASMEVAKISDPNMVIYVRPGTDAGDAASQINAALTAYEATFRQTNAVSLTEIVDVIQQYPGVRAVGWDNPVATEVQLDGTTRETYPIKGVFDLTNGAFTFNTEITPEMIKTLT